MAQIGAELPWRIFAVVAECCQVHCSSIAFIESKIGEHTPLTIDQATRHHTLYLFMRFFPLFFIFLLLSFDFIRWTKCFRYFFFFIVCSISHCVSLFSIFFIFVVHGRIYGQSIELNVQAGGRTRLLGVGESHWPGTLDTMFHKIIQRAWLVVSRPCGTCVSVTVYCVDVCWHWFRTRNANGRRSWITINFVPSQNWMRGGKVFVSPSFCALSHFVWDENAHRFEPTNRQV